MKNDNIFHVTVGQALAKSTERALTANGFVVYLCDKGAVEATLTVIKRGKRVTPADVQDAVWKDPNIGNMVGVTVRRVTNLDA